MHGRKDCDISSFLASMIEQVKLCQTKMFLRKRTNARASITICIGPGCLQTCSLPFLYFSFSLFSLLYLFFTLLYILLFPMAISRPVVLLECCSSFLFRSATATTCCGRDNSTAKQNKKTNSLANQPKLVDVGALAMSIL